MSSVEPRITRWGRRPQLDGLRAVAVYLVVLFHSGSSRFRGGFIGVDVFFVLSGFLVTNVLLTDAATGRIDLTRFYSRRARRLIPAATATIVGTSVAALLMSNRLDRKYMIPDVKAASIWIANWHFIADANDYFASDDLESPLLHFWSLAVEEQFYLLFPFVLIATIRLTRGRIKAMTAVFAGLVVSGVVVQRWWAGADAHRAYMGTDARLYQPIAGALLALVLWRLRLPNRRRLLGELLLGGSLAALLALAILFPSLSASGRGIVAVAAAGVAILGSELNSSGAVAKALAWRPIRYLGAISYGTYLWHWPVVAFSRRLFEIQPQAMFVLSAVIGTGLAALSYELLEQPIRKAKTVQLHPSSTIVAGITIAVVTGFAICPVLLNSNRAPQVLPKERLANRDVVGVTPVPNLDWAAVRADYPNGRPCILPDASDCLIRQGRGQTVFMIGDSHAKMWSPALLALAEQNDWSLYLSYFPSCPWVQGVYRTTASDLNRQGCIENRPATYRQVEAVNPDLVVLAERGFRSDEPDSFATSDDVDVGLDWQAAMATLMATSVAELADGRSVLLVEPIPEVSIDPLGCLVEAEFVEQCAFPAETNTIEESIYRSLAERSPGIIALDLDAEICGELCPAIADGSVVRRDPSHLTASFARRLAPQFTAAIQRLERSAG